MRIESKGRAKYFITFIDDSSRWCEIRFLKRKSEAFEAFKDFKKLVENQKERKLKCLQSDNGTEYLSKEFDEYLRKHGIKRRLAIAYNPEQNGTAERKNRTLLEMARCLLIQSGLPSSFWAEAVSTANYIRNRCPTKSLNGHTPYEAWTGRTPNVSHFKEFGCNVFILDRKPKRGKFEECGKKGIFLGYSDESKGYRVWIPEEMKIVNTRDIKFSISLVDPSENLYEDFLPENAERKEDASLPHTVDIDIRPINIPLIEEQESDDRNEGGENEVDRNEDIAENENDENNDAVERVKRGPGRPRKILTGLRGRPRKQYHPPLDEATYAESYEAFVAEIPAKQAVSGPDSEDWFLAMADEVKSILKNDTWLLVERPGNEKIIGSRMVLRNKYKPDGSLDRRKARIVARGFAQQPGIHFNQTFAPVARLSSIRLLVALAANYGMKIKQLDVTTAYLNGVIKEKILMETPRYLTEALETIVRTEKNYSEIRIKAEKMLQELKIGDKVCLLKKSLYGLRQAGRSWHEKLDEMLRNFGAISTNADPCVYYTGQGEDILLIAVYVDDILVASRIPGKAAKLKEYLSLELEIKDLGEPKYCLGIEFARDKNKIAMHQMGYIREVLERFGMTDSNPVSTPMDVNVKLTKLEQNPDVEERKLPFRELVGALMYLAVATRPDIAHAVSVLSQFNTCYGKVHWTAAKRVLRYLKGSNELGLIFDPGTESLKGYVDADWASCSMDRRSYTGYIFILGNGAISWDSKKQRTVALSSTEAEYMGLAEAAKETIHLQTFLEELGFENLSNSMVLNDNMGAQRLAENPIFHARTKHIDVRHHFVREAVQKKKLRLEHVSTDDMIADMLTKALPKTKHMRCLDMLGLGTLNSSFKDSSRLEGKCCI
jgi:Reverse transcriptase (RNA-dependent DNA polymerase)./Integrase core domain.